MRLTANARQRLDHVREMLTARDDEAAFRLGLALLGGVPPPSPGESPPPPLVISRSVLKRIAERLPGEGEGNVDRMVREWARARLAERNSDG